MELRVFSYGLVPGMYINQKCFLSDSSVGSTWSGLYQPKTKSRRQIELTHYGRYSIYRQLHMLAISFTIAGLALLTDFFDETYRTAYLSTISARHPRCRSSQYYSVVDSCYDTPTKHGAFDISLGSFISNTSDLLFLYERTIVTLHRLHSYRSFPSSSWYPSFKVPHFGQYIGTLVHFISLWFTIFNSP